MSNLTPDEIQDINRRIAAGTYVHEEKPEVNSGEEKPKRGRPRKQVEVEEVATDE